MASESSWHWGILGGTFDPVHNGHITLASEIYRKKNLDGVLLVPSRKHPLKKDNCSADFVQRSEMLALAAEDYDFFEISHIEVEEELSGYTIDTIRALKRSYPGRTFYFIIGTDNLCEFASWHKPDEILLELKLLVGSRPGYRLREVIGLPADRIEIIETQLVDVSSTELRQKLKSGAVANELDTMLPFVVRQYIAERRLYL